MGRDLWNAVDTHLARAPEQRGPLPGRILGRTEGKAKLSSNILVSGLTIVRNGQRLDYPFLEAIASALPVCDEFIVVVGQSDDDTLEQVRAIDDPRLRIVETVWSQKVRPRKSLLAQQTNIGLHLCQGDWCLYVQANEVLHERSHGILRGLMEKYRDDERVEAMLLERLTFWADYQHYLGAYPNRFKFVPRIVRPYIGTYSIRDAMSFAVFDRFSTRGRYPRSIDTDEDIYRYGFVRSIEKLNEKFRNAVQHQEKQRPVAQDHYLRTYPRSFIRRFAGTHPGVMRERVANFPEQYDEQDPRCRTSLTLKERQRLWETRLYERFGLPRWRHVRYKLVGGYLPKQRTVAPNDVKTDEKTPPAI